MTHKKNPHPQQSLIHIKRSLNSLSSNQILGFLTILLLIVGVVVGRFLGDQGQELRNRAQETYDCTTESASTCINKDFGDSCEAGRTCERDPSAPQPFSPAACNCALDPNVCRPLDQSCNNASCCSGLICVTNRINKPPYTCANTCASQGGVCVDSGTCPSGKGIADAFCPNYAGSSASQCCSQTIILPVRTCSYDSPPTALFCRGVQVGLPCLGNGSMDTECRSTSSPNPQNGYETCACIIHNNPTAVPTDAPDIRCSVAPITSASCKPNKWVGDACTTDNGAAGTCTDIGDPDDGNGYTNCTCDPNDVDPNITPGGSTPTATRRPTNTPGGSSPTATSGISSSPTLTLTSSPTSTLTSTPTDTLTPRPTNTSVPTTPGAPTNTSVPLETETPTTTPPGLPKAGTTENTVMLLVGGAVVIAVGTILLLMAL